MGGRFRKIFTGICLLFLGQQAALAGPGILLQPTGQTVQLGNSASFGVTAIGVSLTYQWYFNSAAISGATSAAYNITTTVTNNTGNYFVVISGVGGSVTSSVVSLMVQSPATITLGNVQQTYDGGGHAVTTTTSPAGLPVSITYNGFTNLPVNPGVYLVNASITAPNYTGSASGTLKIVKLLTLSGITASNKVYDGTTSATVNVGSVLLVGIIGLDIVLITGTGVGHFDTATAGSNKTVTVTGFTLTGLDCGNYVLVNPTTTATIFQASSTNSLSSSSNIVGTTSNVTFTASITSGVSVPTGNVLFKDGSTVLSTSPLNGSGVATFSTTVLSHGTHTVVAAYAGDTNYAGSTNSVSELVDSPPSAPTQTFQRNSVSSFKIRVAGLIAGDSDPENDALSLFSFNPTSTMGGTVKQSGSWFLYAPAAGSTNADSFSYVISDSYGLKATGSVSINPSTDTSLAKNIDTITNFNTSATVVHFNGIPGRNYSIQAATNVPFWQPLGTANSDSSGKMDYIDSTSAYPSPRNYRSNSL